jgi:hypothetical protein
VRIIKLILITGSLLLLSSAQASAFVIDTFDDATFVQANVGTPTDSAITASGSFLGTNRKLEVNHISGANNVDAEIDASGNSLLNISLGGSTIGDVSVLWDNLGGIDITAGATLNAISLGIVFDDLPADITIQLFDGTFLGQLTHTTIGGIFSPETANLLFASFSNTANLNFTSIESIKLIVEPLFPAADLQIDFIETAFVVVPEPSTALLFGGGLLVLGLRRRQ